MKRAEDKLQDGKLIVRNELKKSIFDWVAAGIIVAIIAAALDIFDISDPTKMDWAQFLISWLPYFLAAMLLNTDLYKKGVFVGKGTNKFISVVTAYSDIANSLTGEQLKNLVPFCDEYNVEALKEIQRNILRKEGVTYEMFNDGTDDIPPLKTLTKTQLYAFGYNKEQYKVIKKAKKVNIKGISVNILLSSINTQDITNLGLGEHALAGSQYGIMAAKYIVTTLIMSLIAVKDIAQWGWAGIVIVIFKVTYLAGASYMSYFKGYDDATISLVAHLTRKTDILKQYLNYIPKQTEEVLPQ